MLYAVAVTTSTFGAFFLSGKAPAGRNRRGGDGGRAGRSAYAPRPLCQRHSAPTTPPTKDRRRALSGDCSATRAPKAQGGAGRNSRTTAHDSPCGGRHLCHAYTQGRGQRHRLYTLAGLRGNLRVRTPSGVPLLGGVWGAPRHEMEQLSAIWLNRKGNYYCNSHKAGIRRGK